MANDEKQDIELRPARDGDSAGVIALIARVYGEYPGCILDVDREEPGLLAPASSFDGFWVLERRDRARGEVVGCCAYVVHDDDHGERVFEIKKVYLDRALRGRGLGRWLIETLERRAAELGLRRLVLWSDTRFATAHAVYERLGYTRTGKTRALHDLSDSREYHFEKRLDQPGA
jgi:putative acetyltransferase